jgi:hypothetical protein
VPAPNGRARGAARARVARQADENANRKGNRERDQGAMLDFVGETAQRLISELGRIATDFDHLAAHGVGASAQILGDAAQRRSDALANMIHCLRGGCGRAAASCFEVPLQRAQTPIYVPDLGGDCAGISGSLKHDCCRRAMAVTPP